MKILIREGSAAKNFDALHPLIAGHNEMVMLCSDDLHPNDLKNGHINLTIKRALEMGYELFDVLSCCTLNPVKHYNLDCGLLQPGDKADMIVVDDLNNFKVKKTFIDGNLIAEDGICLFDRVELIPVNKFITDKKNEIDFKVEFTGGKLRVIEIIPGELMTNEVHLSPKVKEGNIIADPDRDILKIAVVNRYESAPPAVGFIKGFGIKEGAVASSVAHDSHNIICVGVDDRSMAQAVNKLIENRGGLSVVYDNEFICLPLPIGGIMSVESCEEVAEKYEIIENKVMELGSGLKAPMMTLSFMALIVIPNLKLSDKGLFDINKFDFVELAC